MSQSSSESGGIHQFGNDENYYDEDDLITLQFESNQINFYYSQLSRYSKVIRDKYLSSDVRNHFLHDLCNFKDQQNLNTNSVLLFFKLLQNEFNIDQTLTYEEYRDLFKLGDFLQVKKFLINLNQYFNSQNNVADFQIQIILHEIKSNANTENLQYQLNKKMEDLLSSRIEECLQNEKFAKIPISMVYRIIEKSDKKQLSSDLLYNFIKKDVKAFFVLFSFLDVEFLSDENFDDLFESFSNPNGSFKPFIKYLPCSLSYINKLKKDKKDLQKQVDDLKLEKTQIQSNLTEIEKMKNSLKKSFDDVQIDKNKIEQENRSLQKKLNDSEQMKNQVEQENKNLMQQLNDVKKEKDDLKKQMEDNMIKITGKIDACVKKGLIFYGKINLTDKGNSLDRSKSKCIVSRSSEKSINLSEYEKGESITSLNFTTADFAGKAGTYYIRALIVDSRGKFFEIVSNPVTTSGGDISFSYVEKAENVVLTGGRYKLEVWGGQGGKSVGTSQGNGGLGGYSTGILSIQKETKVYVYVGGQGRTAKSSDGAETRGTFPDGGGTKTGHWSSEKAVPGTGGGSTSIRLVNDSLYTRVIVAGGGGGASGTQGLVDHGGFGGGVSGGNSYCESWLRDQGAGTQTGSTPGPAGSGVAGVAGTFGKGATGLYCQNCDSGGGGGGGWFGGGSGGYGGNCNCASGGGGSGWVFTETSMNTFKSGDSTNANKFLLDPSFYLADASTKPGNTSFPNPSGGTETGHSGNGYAKIVPL